MGFRKMLPSDFVVVGLKGGDASLATSAVCVDLDPVPTEDWAALVRVGEVNQLIEQTGATIVRGPVEWDGSLFGDRNKNVELINSALVGTGIRDGDLVE